MASSQVKSSEGLQVEEFDCLEPTSNKSCNAYIYNESIQQIIGYYVWLMSPRRIGNRLVSLILRLLHALLKEASKRNYVWSVAGPRCQPRQRSVWSNADASFQRGLNIEIRFAQLPP